MWGGAILGAKTGERGTGGGKTILHKNGKKKGDGVQQTGKKNNFGCPALPKKKKTKRKTRFTIETDVMHADEKKARNRRIIRKEEQRERETKEAFILFMNQVWWRSKNRPMGGLFFFSKEADGKRKGKGSVLLGAVRNLANETCDGKSRDVQL